MPRAIDFPGPPRKPRGQRLLPQPLRRSRYPHSRRRWRMEHDLFRRRRRQQDSPLSPIALSPFPGITLLRIHLLLRLQGEQRRIQADGPGAFRPTHLSKHDRRSTVGSQGRRQLSLEHGLLQLLPWPDHDESAVCAAVRRSAAPAGIQTRPTPHGLGGQHSNRRRGDPAADGRGGKAANENEEPRPGRRGCAELRGQQPTLARRSFREHLDSTRGRRCRRCSGGSSIRLAPTPEQAAPTPAYRFAKRLPPWTTILLSRYPGLLDASRSSVSALRQRSGAAGIHRPTFGRGKSRGLVSGSDGVRPARFRRP